MTQQHPANSRNKKPSGFAPIERTEKQQDHFEYIHLPGATEPVAVRVGSGEPWRTDRTLWQGYEKYVDEQEQMQ